MKMRFFCLMVFLAITVACVSLAICGVNEIAVVSIMAFCMVVLIIGEMRNLRKKEEPQQEDLDLIDFFSRGGVAYYWQKGGKQQKCYTYEEFLKIKADYVELWLNQNRYIFKQQADKL